MNFKLIKQNKDFIDECRLYIDDDIIKWFPLIKHQLFKRFIHDLFEIRINNTCIGVVFTTKARGEFSEYGKHDISIIIKPEFQGRGYGKSIIELSIKRTDGSFFIVHHENHRMLSLLNKMSLTEIRLSNYNVFVLNKSNDNSFSC